MLAAACLLPNGRALAGPSLSQHWLQPCCAAHYWLCQTMAVYLSSFVPAQYNPTLIC